MRWTMGTRYDGGYIPRQGGAHVLMDKCSLVLVFSSTEHMYVICAYVMVLLICLNITNVHTHASFSKACHSPVRLLLVHA
jgi:hypothetical protein